MENEEEEQRGPSSEGETNMNMDDLAAQADAIGLEEETDANGLEEEADANGLEEEAEDNGLEEQADDKSLAEQTNANSSSEGETNMNVEGHAVQADANVLVRPRGYKDVEEMAAPMQTVTLDVSTQVTEKAIDQEWAKTREIILATDDILWPTVQEFTLEKGGQRVHDYITMCWKLDKKWMFTVHPVQTFSDHLRKRYIYEVKFSVPTPLSPMPQATASVFFNYEISHFASKDEVVKVHYVVEGTRFVHYPATLPFQDKWLWSVISDKIRLQRSVDF